ncbi:MAG: (2Fe-2S)-binding protein [Dethiobacter sp.]|jgi:predicted molibdopterin-dependent oxidoreductase YjgC|nr:(2Fe-2S)-binding protein [Dethiobacter sp.]
MRISDHPILGKDRREKKIIISVDGKEIEAVDGEPIAAALLAAGIRVFRKTPKTGGPRGVFCAIGRCTDCIMTVNGLPNVRTCVTPVEQGMEIETQIGHGKWKDER